MHAFQLKRLPIILAGGMLLLLASRPGMAQRNYGDADTITGRVLLAPGMVNASGATVTLSSGTGQFVSSTVTNTDGRFSFSSMSLSNAPTTSGHDYVVSASLPGYRPAESTLNMQFEAQGEATLILQPLPNASLSPNYSLGRYALTAKAKSAYQRAVKLLQKNDYPHALSALASVVAAEPAFAPGYQMMGEAYARLHQRKQARRAWRKALQLDPTLIPSAVSLARYNNDHHRWQRALKRLHAATAPAAYAKVSPPSAKAPAAARPWQWYWEMGRAEYGSQHWRRAQTALAHAEAAGATPANLHVLLANLAVRGHNFPAARHEFELYLKADPHGKFAHRARAIVKDMIAHHIPEPNGQTGR